MGGTANSILDFERFVGEGTFEVSMLMKNKHVMICAWGLICTPNFFIKKTIFVQDV